MLPEVTQDNIYLFLPYKAAKISTAIRRDSQIGLKEALLSFYQSSAYRLLEQEDTKLWHRSPEQIYEDYLRPQPSRKRHYQNGPRHSKLAPFASQIHLWRQQGMTLRAIASELAKYGCKTTPQNLCRFLNKQCQQL